MITFTTNYAKEFFETHEFDQMELAVKTAHDQLHTGKGPGADYLGWLNLPTADKDELSRVKQKASEIKEHADVLIVIGIGGSYLGSKAVIQALSHSFMKKSDAPEVIFAGHHLNGEYIEEMFDALHDKSVYVNVISKSGTTTEPAIAFRLVKHWMEERYGQDGAASRIIATTDANKGALKAVADANGYTCFIVPDDVGGRFSVLTPVGLLPIAAAGFSVDALLDGAHAAKQQYDHPSLLENESYQYAAFRTLMYAKGKQIELLASYHPKLKQVSEWWKQLFGESEGKDHKGLFPASVHYTTDLHSLGQYVQEGRRHLFQTVIGVKEATKDVTIPYSDSNEDGLDYLVGKSLNEVNDQAMVGTLLAHVDGGVPNVQIEVDQLDEVHIGALIYFFEKACAISGTLLGVNPFDQPGVESYKQNMFALLGKEGFEERRKQLQERLLT